MGESQPTQALDGPLAFATILKIHQRHDTARQQLVMAPAQQVPPMGGPIPTRMSLRLKQKASVTQIDTATMTAPTAGPSSPKKYKYTRPGPIRNNEYLIEDILDARYNSFVTGKWQYLVQWAGWPKNEASWLSRHDVDASWIEEYWRRQNAGFLANRAEAGSAKAFFAAAKVVTKWTRDSTRYSIFTWMTQREKAAKRAEQRARAKRRRFR